MRLYDEVGLEDNIDEGGCDNEEELSGVTGADVSTAGAEELVAVEPSRSSDDIECFRQVLVAIPDETKETRELRYDENYEENSEEVDVGRRLSGVARTEEEPLSDINGEEGDWDEMGVSVPQGAKFVRRLH